MTTLRIPVAIATTTVALLCASVSSADGTTQQTTTTTQATPPTVTTTTPTQQPTATTQTTAAPYSPPGGERFSERRIEKRPNRTLLSTGAGIFVLSYGASVIAGAASDRNADNKLFIPVAGPWLDLGDRGCSPADPCGSNEDVAKAMIITSGVVQGAGVLLALSSLVIPESTTVEERTTTAKAKAVKPQVSVVPVSLRSGAGVGLVGRF